ncbi:MAG: DUF4164 domain-containing protein [Microcystis aeruginosa Ma_AC_P_19900807_S299]|nr:MAG: DUF4164 domain-containing protein [Microcystis aeruginosa Ma_AC_P_19900807_S299]
MSNETVTYSLESVLKEIKDSIKEVNQKIDTLQQDINQKFDKIDERLTKLEVGQGTQKNQVWTLIILLGGAIGTAAWRSFFSGNP